MPKTITLKEGQYLNENETLEIKGTPAVLKGWIADRGFGFLILEDGSEIFCHVNELCSHLLPSKRGELPRIERGQTVYVQGVVQGIKDRRAEKVSCECCAGPDIWELHPSEKPNNIAFTVRKMVAVCVNHPGKSESYFRHPILETINAAYQEAVRKKVLFINPNGQHNKSFSVESYAHFFETFGQPQTIRPTGSWDRLILIYPNYGEVQIPLSHALEGGFFEITATGEWKKETNLNQSNIMANFIFDGFQLQCSVGYSSRQASGLNGAFEKLPKETQDEIIEELKANIPSPEEKAEQDFWSGLEENKNKIAILRDAIVRLKSPGKAFYYERQPAKYQRGKFKYEDKDYIDGGGVFLNLGLREYVNAFTDNCIEITGKLMSSPDDMRRHLLEVYQARYQELINQSAKEEPHFKDPRLATMPEEEWKMRYQKTFNAFAKEQKAEYDERDGRRLQEMEEAWERENQATEQAKALYEEYYQLERANKALDHRVRINRDLSQEYPGTRGTSYFKELWLDPYSRISYLESQKMCIAHVTECIAKLKAVYAKQIEREREAEEEATPAEEEKKTPPPNDSPNEGNREVNQPPKKQPNSGFGVSLGDKLAGLKDLLDK